MLDPNKIETFLSVAETLNFSETAKKLHITQSAVSQQVHTLEQQLQVALFHRDGPRISLTDDGLAFLLRFLYLGADKSLE